MDGEAICRECGRPIEPEQPRLPDPEVVHLGCGVKRRLRAREGNRSAMHVTFSELQALAEAWVSAMLLPLTVHRDRGLPVDLTRAVANIRVIERGGRSN